MLLVIAFLVFGPKEFPVVVKNFIKFLNELRSVGDNVKSEFYDLKTESQKHVQKITKGLEKDFKAVGDILKEKPTLKGKDSKKPTFRPHNQ